MGLQNRAKLNHLHTLLEEGLLASTGWLVDHGFNRTNLATYSASGALESPVRGLYRRPGPPLKWQHVVASVQLLHAQWFHVGGRTALIHHGHGHFVRMRGDEEILLYGPESLPSWVSRLGLKEKFASRNDAMFSSLRAGRDGTGALVAFPDKPIERTALDSYGLREEPWGAWDWPLLFSVEERAILEMLQDVPSRESVHDAFAILQGLAGLRPERMSRLLAACGNVKVKRLFLALADRCGHAWFKHLDLAQVDQGSGKRMLVPGGKLDAKYRITLPADLGDHTR
jgi:hypothetical protein